MMIIMIIIPWKFICDLWFHEVLQTTMVKQTSGNQRAQTNFHGIKYINLIYIYVYIYIKRLLVQNQWNTNLKRIGDKILNK